MDAASAMKPRRDVFITGHAIPSSSLDSMHPKPCDHPMESSRPPAVKCTEINGSVMAAVGYHKKHVMTDHDCGMQPPQRVRSNTVPTALLRRLRNGAAAEPTSVHATADGLVHRRGPNARTASLESLESRERHDARTTRHDEIVMSHMKHKQQDECLLRHRRSTDSVLSYPRPLSPALPSEELSAVTLLDQCMDAADDEFYTVYRDPLPKGSSVFEKVTMRVGERVGERERERERERMGEREREREREERERSPGEGEGEGAR